MNIHELKALNEQSEGKFFTRGNMKFAGDTMKSFKFTDNHDGTADVIRKRDGTKWIFSTKTGLVVKQGLKDAHTLIKLAASLPLHRISCHNFAFPRRLHD